MARILRGVKGPLASSAGGGVGVLLCGGVPVSPCQSLRPVSLAPCLRCPMGLPSLPGACLGRARPAVCRGPACLPWALFCPVRPFLVSGGSGHRLGRENVSTGLKMGFNRLLFFSPACGVHLQREKSRFLPFLCLACLPALSACPLLCVVSSYDRQKRKAALLWVALSLWVVFGFSFQNSNTASGAGFLPYIFILWVSLSVSILRAVGLAI